MLRRLPIRKNHRTRTFGLDIGAEDGPQGLRELPSKPPAPKNDVRDTKTGFVSPVRLLEPIDGFVNRGLKGGGGLAQLVARFSKDVQVPGP